MIPLKNEKIRTDVSPKKTYKWPMGTGGGAHPPHEGHADQTTGSSTLRTAAWLRSREAQDLRAGEDVGKGSLAHCSQRWSGPCGRQSGRSSNDYAQGHHPSRQVHLQACTQEK